MSFMAVSVLGVKLWIWLYLAFSFTAGVGVLIYWHREKIRKKYYEFRFPEKLIKVVIHYKSQMMKEYWRLIPDNDVFTVAEKDYRYVDKVVMKHNDFYVRMHDSKPHVMVEGTKYNIDELKKIKVPKNQYPEIHYFYNAPDPIFFDIGKKEIGLTSEEMNKFTENNLFNALLTLDANKGMIIFAIMLGVMNFIATMFVIAKLMGWVK